MKGIEAELTALARHVPLPPDWSTPETFSEVVEIGGLEMFSVGLVASREGRPDAVGSAVELGAFPFRRAYFELVERCALLDAMAQPLYTYALRNEAGEQTDECTAAAVFPSAAESETWCYAKSNGVAAGPDWVRACRSARAELVERHCILSAWYGFTDPAPIDGPRDGALARLEEVYELACYRFPSPAETSLEVAGVFGFPRSDGAPLVYGFGADVDQAGALSRSTTECLQRLAFLWGEAIPSEAPPFGKTPDYHQEMFLWPPMHARLRAWLGGTHRGRAGSSAPRPAEAPVASGFIDLTPSHLLESTASSVRVAKAIPTWELELTFGRGHPRIEVSDADLAVHPIA